MYKLAICIPTYNRLEYLKVLLESIFCQIQNGVEIVISDNASVDGTEDYCRSLCQTRTDITYYRQESNCGSDLNMLKVIDLATAEYCWWFGDDDRLRDGALQRMLSLLESHPSIVVANSVVMDRSLTVIRGQSIPECDISTSDNALMSFGSWITFLSSLCFHRMKFLDLLPVTRTKIGSQLMQCYPMISLIMTGPVGYDRTPMVDFRSENSGGYNLYQVFVEQYDQMCEYAGSIGFKMTTLASIRRNVAWKVLIPVTLERKVSGVSLNRKDGFWHVIHGEMDFITKMIVVVAMLVPRPLVSPIKRSYRVIKKCLRSSSGKDVNDVI